MTIPVFGLDVGTSVVKAAAFDGAGNTLAVASCPAKTHSLRPGWAEQDLDEIIEACRQVLDELRARVGPPELLALTAHGDGLWLLDDEGRAIRPGVLWSDGRAASIVAGWERDGTATSAYRVNGNVPFAGSAAALMRWMAEHEAEALGRARTAGYLKDALVQRLTGVRATDGSDASLPFLDVRARQYDPALLRLFRLEEHAGLLAPIDPVPSPIRVLTGGGAALIGLQVGTPVHAGPFDFPASLIGSGVRRPGDGLIALGTTLACGVLVDRIDTAGTPSGMTICHPQSDRWVRLLPAMAGTLALDWLLPLIGATHADLDGLLQQSPAGVRGLLVLPFVSPAGERAPFVDSAARGRVLGLSTEHGRADLVRAACEGIAYAARHCLDEAGLTADGAVTIAGGGARSVGLQQILAGVLGRPLRRARQPEPGARGAVITALKARGDAIDIDAWTRPDGEIEPDAVLISGYEDGYRRYRAEVDRARAEWTGVRS